MEELPTELQGRSPLARCRPLSSPPVHTACGPGGIGLSTRVTQGVKIVNAIFHLTNKDWGKKTCQTIGK